MNRELPDTLYIQDDGKLLLVNRTPLGALQQHLGYRGRAGEVVGVYRLDRMVSLNLAAEVVEIKPPATEPVAETPTEPQG